MTQISWIHPSMRDLAIDYLIGHPAERLEFLSRTDSKGFLLAISASGGEEGKRSLPLLQTGEDWQVLSHRAGELVGECSLADVGTILTAVQSLLLRERAMREAEATEQTNALAKTVLDNVRLRWDASGSDIDIRQLRTYLELTVLVRPLLPTPNVEPTWSRWNFADKILADDIAFDERELDQLGWWVALVDLLSSWEPRWLRFVGFSEKTRKNVLEALVRQLASLVDELDDLEESDIDPVTGEPADPSVQEYEDRHALEQMVDVLDMLLGLIHGDAEKVFQGAFTAANEHLQVRERRAEAREEFESYEPDPPEEWISSSGSSQTGEVFSVDAFFSDL